MSFGVVVRHSKHKALDTRNVLKGYKAATLPWNCDLNTSASAIQRYTASGACAGCDTRPYPVRLFHLLWPSDLKRNFKTLSPRKRIGITLADDGTGPSSPSILAFSQYVLQLDPLASTVTP